MTVTHRTPEGGWAVCAKGLCMLPFHFPGMTPQEMAAAPLEVLLPLFELMQPPHLIATDGASRVCKEWLDEFGQRHRGYDLPAVTRSNGDLYWYRYGELHREGDQPAQVEENGERGWYWHGDKYRMLLLQPDGTLKNYDYYSNAGWVGDRS